MRSPNTQNCSVDILSRDLFKRLLQCLVFCALWGASYAYAAAPVAEDDLRRIIANSSITLNPLTNDYDPDGDSFAVIAIGTPGNGSATLNGDGSVFYRPNPDFVGTDSFSYTIRENTEMALEATATITVRVLEDDIVAFAEGNNSRRFAGAMESVCSRLRETSDSELGAVRRNLLERCNAMDVMIENESDQMGWALRQMTPEETIAQMRISADASRTQVRAIAQRIQQLQRGNSGFTVNGMPLMDGQGTGGAASADEEIWSRFGLFASIQQESAEKDVTQLENGYDYSANSFTLGADYRMDRDTVLGAALGLSRNKLDYAQQGGELDTDIVSFIAFGSHYINNYSFDLQLGYSNTAFDSQRNISYSEVDGEVNEVLQGSTKGSQWLVNTQVQWEWHRNSLTLYPFLAADYLENTVSGYGEQGNSGLAMIIGEQSMSRLTLSAGLQATYSINTSWGVLVPSAQVTLLGDVNSDYDPVLARFAYDPDPDNNFSVGSDGGDKNYIEATLGTSAVFQHGLSAFLQYRQLTGYDNLSAHQIQAGIRYEL